MRPIVTSKERSIPIDFSRAQRTKSEIDRSRVCNVPSVVDDAAAAELDRLVVCASALFARSKLCAVSLLLLLPLL